MIELVSSIRTLCVIYFTVLYGIRGDVATWACICNAYDYRFVEIQIQQNKLRYGPGAALYSSSGLFYLTNKELNKNGT